MEDDVLMCKYRRDFCVLILCLIQSPDLSLLEFRKLLTSPKFSLPETVLNSFDETLDEIREIGVGKLLDMVDSLDKVLSPSDSVNDSKTYPTNNSFPVAKTSVIGKSYLFIFHH